MPRQDVTKWRPDTCDCEVYFRIDKNGNVVFLPHEDVIAEHQRRIDAKDLTANPVISPPAKLCPVHANLGHKLHQTLVDAITEEQKLKNMTLARAAEIAGVNLEVNEETIRNEIMSDQALSSRDKVVKVFTTVEALKHDAVDFIRNYKWEFDEERNLKVSHPRLNAEQKKLLQDEIDGVHGKGKVKVS